MMTNDNIKTDYFPYKVSVIIPVHNAGNRLLPCIESLINQTIDSIQLIFVLDAPTDGSDKVVKSFSQNENVVIIENEESLHIGKCRNIGLSYATGKYIGFCDHDDYCDPSMYEILYSKMEEGADIVFSPFVACDSSLRISAINEMSVNSSTTPNDIFISQIGLIIADPPLLRNLLCSKTIWNRLYKSSIIRKYNIQFVDTKEVVPEDTIFNIEYCFHVDSFSVVNKYLYYHIYHLSNTGESLGYKSYDKYIKGFEYLHDFFKRNKIEDKYNIKERLYDTIRHNVYRLFSLECNKKGVIPACKSLIKLRDIKIIKEAYKNNSQFTLKESLSIKTRILNRIIKFII